ncbi:MAG: hypothetical protein Q8O40_02220 [Chloroflexota bacterium]|nr:hypothetical protein [Chloroflexota bacterium]
MKRMKRWLWAGLVLGLSLAALLANLGWLRWTGADRSPVWSPICTIPCQPGRGR